MSEMAAPSTVRERDYYHDDDVREQVGALIENGLALLGPVGDYPFGAVDSLYAELGSAFPEDHGCAIPDEGAWIMVKRLPHTAIPNPPLYSMWRARPVYVGRTFKVVAGRRRRNVSWPMLKARIATQHGDLDLFPGEYTTVKDLGVWLDLIGQGVTVNFLGDGEPGELAEQIFYMQAHGLRRRDALLLVLPTLVDQNFAYLTLDNSEDL